MIPVGNMQDLMNGLGLGRQWAKIMNKEAKDTSKPETVTDANGIIWHKNSWDAPDGKKIEFLEVDIMHLIDLDRLQPELSWGTEYAPMEEPDVLQLTLTRWPKTTKVRALYASWADDGSDWQTQQAERQLPYCDYDGDGPMPLGPSSVEKKLLFTFPNWRIDKDWKAVVTEISDEFVQWFKVDRFSWSEQYQLDQKREAKELEEKNKKYPRKKRRNYGLTDIYWQDEDSNWTDFMDAPY